MNLEVIDDIRAVLDSPRLQGTNATEAKKIIDESGLKVYSAILLQEAADLVNKVLK